MEQKMKIAVCDDREDDRKRIIEFLQEYADKNELYPEIEEFTSGEEFLSTDVLKLSDGTEIGISRMKRKEIQEAFADYSWRSTRRRMQGYR